MLGVNENSECTFILDGMNRISKDRLKPPISPFLEVGFKNSLTAICKTT